MIIISNETKKTKEMEQYEKDTGKSAILKGKITDGFKQWKKDDKISNLEKERISVYLTIENKKKWQNFAQAHKISTISKLIREGVNYYIEEKSKPFSKIFADIDADANISISHEFKERLTTIKGYLQLIIEENKDKWDAEAISLLNNVLEESKQLEIKIVNKLDKVQCIADKYDILVIEDDMSTVDLLERFFIKRGYSVKGALTGSKGIEELKFNIPKLILLDIILPDISGFDICKILKSDETFKDTTIYYLTAIPDSEVEKRLEETQADGYILKPFNLDDLEFLKEFL